MSRIEQASVSKYMVKKKEGHTLRDIFILKLRALYDIEQALIRELPKMIAAASDQDLKTAFRDHYDETRAQVQRLEYIFEELGEKPKRTKVEAIRGMAKDTKWVAENINGDEARDLVLIGSAGYVEHYEMAGYMTAIQWAHELELGEIAGILNDTLTEEISADIKLTNLGKRKLTERLLPLSAGEAELKNKPIQLYA
jgi:ferritin-like metal-binding protein YciE